MESTINEAAVNWTFILALAAIGAMIFAIIVGALFAKAMTQLARPPEANQYEPPGESVAAPEPPCPEPVYDETTLPGFPTDETSRYQPVREWAYNRYRNTDRDPLKVAEFKSIPCETIHTWTDEETGAIRSFNCGWMVAIEKPTDHLHPGRAHKRHGLGQDGFEWFTPEELAGRSDEPAIAEADDA